MDDEIEIKNYSEQQLIEALSSVDDEKYFDNALLIYQTILDKSNWNYSEVTVSTLGYATNWYFEFFWYLLVRSPLALTLFADIEDENHQMDEKISRINQHLAEQKKLCHQT